jgi:hypothetical protein
VSTTAPAIGNKYRISTRNAGGAISSVSGTTITVTVTTGATGGTGTSGSPAWATSSLVGRYVTTWSTTGARSTSVITGNAANTITVASWGTTPVAGGRWIVHKLPNAMLGASGVNVATFNANWAGAGTYSPAAGSTTALSDATTQWQVCFKCHSGANTSLATWSSSWSNLATDFNPNNASFHPVVGALVTGACSTTGPNACQLNTAEMTNGWKPGDVMYCSDCHGNDDQATAGASQGPHASAVKFILRGPNTKWPFQSNGTTRWTPGNYTTNQGNANGLFCLNCHTLKSTPHTDRSNHSNLACTSCHIQLPHGGKVKRLMRTTNTPAPYIDAGAPASLNAYSGGNATNSCGASCTGTHSLGANATNSW